MLIFAVSMLYNVNQNQRYSPKQLFFKENILELSMQKLGVIATSCNDVKAVISGSNNAIELINPDSIRNLNYEMKKDAEGIDRAPNIDKNIDLKKYIIVRTTMIFRRYLQCWVRLNQHIKTNILACFQIIYNFCHSRKLK